ncbi:MAG TPA: hypothetical protein PLA25_08070 [Anaerolineaceae bacterium]|mgnify:CR=1 FL=1|nr:hypothetical protein [Anaerolineaceae bacterium]
MTTPSLQWAVDKIGQASSAMAAIYSAYMQKVKEIKQNNRLNEVGKKEVLDELYAEMKERHLKARTNFVNTLKGEQDRLRDLAFSVVTDAQRNAVARAAATHSMAELRELYDLATVTSDPVLLAAVGAQAYVVGDWDMLGAVSEKNEKVADFMEFERNFGRLRSNDTKLEQNMLISQLPDPSGISAS